MKTALTLLLTLTSLFSISVSGQETQAMATSTAPRITSEDYNIPPGALIMPKSDLTVDYSHLLPEIEAASGTSGYVRAQFIKEISQEDWTNMQVNDPEAYAYYSAAKTFYDNLSPKVKVVLTTEQLWHIYMFDQRLKNQLTNY